MADQSFKLSHKDGSFYKDGATCGVRFERVLEHPIERVWEALTVPEHLEQWLAPAVVDDGSITLQLTGGTMGGKIMEWEENSILEYAWHNGSVVRWQLFPLGRERCRLVFTHSNVVESQLRGAATGWHYHMDVLALVLAGKKGPDAPVETWEYISREASARYQTVLEEMGRRVLRGVHA